MSLDEDFYEEEPCERIDQNQDQRQKCKLNECSQYGPSPKVCQWPQTPSGNIPLTASARDRANARKLVCEQCAAYYGQSLKRDTNQYKTLFKQIDFSKQVGNHSVTQYVGNALQDLPEIGAGRSKTFQKRSKRSKNRFKKSKKCSTKKSKRF